MAGQLIGFRTNYNDPVFKCVDNNNKKASYVNGSRVHKYSQFLAASDYR